MLVKTLPRKVKVVNCSTCFKKGKRWHNRFEIYGKVGYKYKWLFFQCLKCNSIFKKKTMIKPNKSEQKRTTSTIKTPLTFA